MSIMKVVYVPEYAYALLFCCCPAFWCYSLGFCVCVDQRREVVRLGFSFLFAALWLGFGFMCVCSLLCEALRAGFAYLCLMLGISVLCVRN